MDEEKKEYIYTASFESPEKAQAQKNAEAAATLFTIAFNKLLEHPNVYGSTGGVVSRAGKLARLAYKEMLEIKEEIKG